jgi:hypothetical protein
MNKLSRRPPGKLAVEEIGFFLDDAVVFKHET